MLINYKLILWLKYYSIDHRVIWRCKWEQSSYVHKIVEIRAALNSVESSISCFSLVDLIVFRFVMIAQTERVCAFFLLQANSTAATE